MAAAKTATSPAFSVDRADRAQAFFERILVHTKGRRWARQPFILADWQRDEIIRPLFGTVRWDADAGEWVRQYRVAWLELARKNGKSEMLAAIALLLICADDEEGAEVYGAAKDREQAGAVFEVAKRMVELSPILSRRLKIYAANKRIVDAKTSSFYRVIAADATGNLGQNPHGIIFDEILTQKNRELWDALRTGVGTRTQPLMIGATTAGNDLKSFAYEEHEYCEKVARDPKLDPVRFVYMRNTPMDADWRDEATWTHANPGLGDFLSIEALRDEAREAELSPPKQNVFRQFRLNQWVRQENRWMDMGLWDQTAGMVNPETLHRKKCRGGLDLGELDGIAAYVLDFVDKDGGHDVLWRFFCPEALIPDLDKQTSGRASVWIREGFMVKTAGDTCDYEKIRASVNADAKLFDLQDIAVHNRTGLQLAQNLESDGVDVVPVSSGARLAPATQELMRLVANQTYRHGGHPVARWMMDGVGTKKESDGSEFMMKGRSSGMITGPMAAAMALDRQMRAPAKRKGAAGF